MVNRRATLVFLITVVCLSAAAQEIPPFTGYVVDNAGILSPQTEATIASLLDNFEEQSTNQIAVLTIPSLDGESIETYANRVFRAWAIGRADLNNGVLLLIAKNDRELRIEVGYGLESSLTDADAGRIIRHVIVPLFRADDFEGGTLAGVNAIIGTINGSYSPPIGSESSDDDMPWWGGLIFLFTHGLLPLGIGVRSLVSPPISRYFTLLFTLMFMVPVVFILGGLWLGGDVLIVGTVIVLLYIGGYIAADIYMSNSPKWQDIRKQVRAAQKSGKSTSIDAGWISFSAGGSSSSGGGGGFSGGGGGSSGGGGASGSW